MIDFSAYIHSEWSWIVLFVMAIFVGMSKTGIQGLAILTVPMLAMTFEAKPSTGLMLPVLCFADIIGVSYYRRQAEWKYIIRLLPMAIAGFFLALWVDNMIPASEFKHLMGACLALVLAVMLWSQWKGKENMLIDTWWYSLVALTFGNCHLGVYFTWTMRSVGASKRSNVPWVNARS